MNRLPILTLAVSLVAALQLHAQTKPALDEFIGISWGANAATVKSTMKSHGGSFKARMSNSRALLFQGGTFANLKAEVQACYMGSKGFFGLAVMSKKLPDAKLLETYRALRATLGERYGAPTNENNQFEAPYSDGDGREAEAIRNGKGQYYVSWTFTNAAGQENEVTLKIDKFGKDLTISLDCTNNSLKD